ncbi:hypothetical protein MPLSOD_140147 [Mesorhizobium sp. SOD10]|nr:hypothetical protein MPLSOD_140147 [Mesorhizobium sp. SOD10]
MAPTEKLVVGGIYRHVRNPMYVAVLAIILGQALIFSSWPVLFYGLIAAAAMISFVKLRRAHTRQPLWRGIRSLPAPRARLAASADALARINRAEGTPRFR